jgi:signal transduction histidine kinase
MNAASGLRLRSVSWLGAFTLLVSALLFELSPRLLLLRGPVADEGALALSFGVLAGGSISMLIGALRLRRYRFLLRALAVGSRAVEAHELYELSDGPRRLLATWLPASALGPLLASTLFRTAAIDPITGARLAILGAAIVAAASLPLFVVLRTTFARAFESAPPEVMREVVEDAERLNLTSERVSRRMLAAVAAPVVCLAFASALVVAAHVRTAEERSREATARIVSRAGLEPGPGLIPYAGMQDALVQARALGFYAYSSSESEEYRVDHGKGGRLTVTTPLDVGSATMEFKSSTVGVLSPAVLLLALLSSAVAGGFGLIAGRALAQDLRVATREVRELGTEAVMTGGTSVVWSARFGMVARLGLAIGTLAARFRVFAQAQERSIEARDAAARMRGLFFASVSHDLKSPLNAILGFTELVRAGGHTTQGQAESLALIERRGRELLALIETILDAARVDAGQLTLVVETADPKALLDEAIAKARDLEGERDVQIVVEIAPGVSSLRVDRVRLARALATFLAYAVRDSEAPSLRVMLGPEPLGIARVDVEVPSENFSVPRFEALLDPTRAPGATEHRGLALALRLGRSIVEAHGGSIEVTLRGGVGRFSIFLPTESSVVPLPGAPPAG